MHAAPSGRIPAQAGIGLRFPHHARVLQERPPVPWWEVHAENYLGGGPSARTLLAIRNDYPVSLHAVGLSLGRADGIDEDHLARLRELADRIEPGLVSDHLSWSSLGGVYLPDLLPLPMTEEALAIVRANVARAQEGLGRRLLIENPSALLRYRHSPIPEAQFLAELVARTGCGLLCDVNNLVVSCANVGGDPLQWLDTVPAAAVGEIHIAGHAIEVLEDGSRLRIDDHGSRPVGETWRLLDAALARFGAVPTLLEWDTQIPPLEVLLEEAGRAQSRLDGLGERRARLAA